MGGIFDAHHKMSYGIVPLLVIMIAPDPMKEAPPAKTIKKTCKRREGKKTIISRMS